jgi:hypothetical protein
MLGARSTLVERPGYDFHANYSVLKGENEMKRERIVKTKSFWTGIAVIISVVLPAAGVPIPPGTTEALLGLLGICLRDAMIH